MHRKSTSPFAIWQTIDGRNHKLWRIQKFNQLINMFNFVENLYILDGHHRFEAGLKYLKSMGENAKQKDKWIQGLLYSTKYIRVYSQYRKIVHEDHQSIIKNLLQNYHLKTKEVQCFEKQSNYDFVLHHDNRYFQIKCGEQQQEQNCDQLAVQKLDKILKQFLQQAQKNNQKYIQYVPSLMFDQKNRTDKYPLFLFKPLTINKIFQIANAGKTLPSKSTWLEPKPCLHMVIRLPY